MNYSEKSTKIISAIICLMMLVAMIVPMSALAADTMDIVLVVDDTESMAKESDKNNISAVAIRKAIDTFPSGNGTRLGIATYDINIMQKLDLGATSDQIIDFAKNNIHRNGHCTDAAVGVKWATDQLNGSQALKKAIILIGDGKNQLKNDIGTINKPQAESDADLAAAINTAKSNGINVYTIAINTSTKTSAADKEAFKAYFRDIADQTGGEAFAPTNVDQIAGILDQIRASITGVQINPDNGNGPKGGYVPANQKITETFEVPASVYEMILQVDHADPLTITLEDPDGDIYDKNRAASKKDITYRDDTGYTTIKKKDPKAGEWKITYFSPTAQNVKPKLIYYANLSVKLSKNTDVCERKVPFNFIAEVWDGQNQITEAVDLENFTDVKIVIQRVDKNGQVKDTKEDTMKIGSGQLEYEANFDKKGTYDVYVQIGNSAQAATSNTLTIDVQDNVHPQWLKWVIIALVIVLLFVGFIVLIIILLVIMKLRNAADYVRGGVAVKITSRQPGDDVAMFQPQTFDSSAAFPTKKSNLSSLINTYSNWYMMVNASSLAEMEVSQHLNSSLREVADKILISGNKKKQTVIKFPAGAQYELTVDDMPVTKAKVISFNSPEREMSISFKNNGCTYTIDLNFMRNQY